MLTLSNWLSDSLLNLAFRNTAWTPPSTVYLALYTSNPTAADTGTEVSGGAYARIAIPFAAPVGQSFNLYDIKTGVAETVTRRTLKSNAELVFAVATAPWGLITHVGIRTALTAGNLMYFGAVNNPRTIETGDRMRVAADSIVVSIG
ncbi:hypothetical protein [Paenibacillus sp. HJGM_3]|uniref:phage tail fiber protein n=1 Tax=Paenibacillus sp. HJGM_3 TaxID=3379816 RepID=UPI00385B0B64